MESLKWSPSNIIHIIFVWDVLEALNLGWKVLKIYILAFKCNLQVKIDKNVQNVTKSNNLQASCVGYWEMKKVIMRQMRTPREQCSWIIMYSSRP